MVTPRGSNSYKEVTRALVVDVTSGVGGRVSTFNGDPASSMCRLYIQLNKVKAALAL